MDGVPAALGTRAFDLLLALAERRERLVGKQELLDLVWPGVVVEEHNITAQISSLRKLLGPGVIATIPGRGYQFVATPDAPAAEEPRIGGAPDEARHNLPEQPTRFIGRMAALAELEGLLAQSRLLTLTGIGGCGKTRLALQLAGQRLGISRRSLVRRPRAAQGTRAGSRGLRGCGRSRHGLRCVAGGQRRIGPGGRR